MLTNKNMRSQGQCSQPIHHLCQLDSGQVSIESVKLVCLISAAEGLQVYTPSQHSPCFSQVTGAGMRNPRASLPELATEIAKTQISDAYL